MTHHLTRLPILILNPHNRCNCRCLMCEIWKRDTVENFTATDLQPHLEALRSLNVETVVLTGGEPLMSTGLWELCREIKALGIRITLLSSGLLLERYAAQITEHIDEVIVSLDGPAAIHNTIRNVPGAFERLTAGIAVLREQQAGFPVAARCTVQQRNCGVLVETLQSAHDLGLHSLSFLAADTHSEAFDRTFPVLNAIALAPEDLAILHQQIDALEATGECGHFIAESPAKLRRIANHFRGTTTAPLCNAPWHSAVVETDGTVRPCFFHAPLGRIDQDHNLAEVLNSAEALAFRTNLDVATNPVCRRCVCSLNRKPASPINPAP